MHRSNVIQLLWVVLTVTFLQIEASDWSAFVLEVEEAINNASSYVLPTNNNAFFTPSENKWHFGKFLDYGTYDFIIIGGGTAGGVLANRLTEKRYTVLVIEAGKDNPNWFSVLGLSSYSYYSDGNWGYNTTRQANACYATKNQQCFYPRGKTLGGSSAINGGLYVRGNARDFDRWEAMGNAGWSYRDCLPYFRKSERAEFTVDIDREFHGFDGPQSIDIPADTPELTAPLLDAFGELGQQHTDYNGRNENGVSRMQFYLDYNIRSSTNQAFIRPIENRSNLKITLESLATKIRISPIRAKAYGVEFVKNGKQYFARAKREVIVSAGTINSPQVLMLSGIGPAKELRRHGIRVRADLPVGENLYDHVTFPGVHYRTNHTFYNNTLSENLNLWREARRPLTAGVTVEVISFWNYEGTQESEPEIEVYVNLGRRALATTFQFNDAYVEAFQSVNDLTDILANIVLLHPKSVGRVTLQSKDPRDYPLIDTNYFSDPRDLETMYQGIQTVLRLNDTETFKNWHAQFLQIPLPGCDENYEALSRNWWYCALRSITYTIFHPIGTTRMGNNPRDSVVDSQLKVHGIKNLRVVDAGVIPSHVSGHTNPPVVMIAEKIADAIKAEHFIG